MRALVIVGILAGCTPASGPNGLPSETTCNAANWQELVGQPEEAIYGALGNLRVIKPGQAVTKDYNPSRLNAVIGRDGRIERFGCY